ncbi:uncharacterized protein LOC108024659 [Drosophila biarmipes]|uniref:uncharacterized protein LOC108024659 n=1 Tax=Drosophila biarmipes TaxID=125945 RepID=UPI0007E77ECC|nr:uncharacterized protein LOC108024659 [Drosophila biarmipes]
MERFAFKIDAALKANLCKICRLCGIDNPQKVNILLPNEGEPIDLDEPRMSQKIYELVGFTVSVDDKMPQTMCSQCVDKINDFYEFREMCYATNKQTRNLLGLKQIEPAKLMDFRPMVKEESHISGAAAKRGRKRKGDDTTWPRSNLIPKQPVKKEPFVWHKKQKLQPAQTAHLQPKTEPEIKEEPAESESSLKGAWKKVGRKSICSVCGEKFLSKELADEHKSLVHVPSIPRYMCNACNQTHHNQSDIRAHQLWHKLSKTPYKCPVCDTSVANAYAFARHMREHTPPTPVQLLVLDRECPLCKKTFVTNFFYNTHRCAIRKRKCGGCSRALNTEAAYMRHAPTCAKIYLNHSKHIMPETVTNEAQMRITNEVEEELLGLPPATTVPPDFVIDEGMLPVVVLERLSSPLLRASAGENRLGATKSRNSERVSSKSYLKRMDQLLKNTMSTLVSIKHEPEVHINDTGPAPEQAESEPEPDEPPGFEDDFRAANDDSEEEAQTEEALERQSAEATVTASASDDVPSVSVKQEPEDDAYDKQMGVKQEPLKLKLKITKNHGKLNSSLIDELDEAGQASGRSIKKKKKRKHKEREKEAPAEAENCRTESQDQQPAVRIKQEPVDYPPEATVMTTIPMTQFESNFNENQQREGDDDDMALPQEDVKPNRMELDRMMQISHVASGVDMAEEAMPLERAQEATADEPQADEQLKKKFPPKVTPVKSTARKSTGGAQRKVPSPPQQTHLPQIVAVVSGESAANMIPNVSIKPEPRNRGYGDEEPEEQQDNTEEINHNDKMEEEDAYIKSLDLNNLNIKQEKDLDISESEPMLCNGLNKGDGGDDDGNEDSASSADEAEEAIEEDEEVRIYREIELPPLEPQGEQEPEETSHRLQVEPVRMDTEALVALPAEETPPQTPQKPQAPGFSLVITNICSQAASEEVGGYASNFENPSPLASESKSLADEHRSGTQESPSPSAKDIPSEAVNQFHGNLEAEPLTAIETQPLVDAPSILEDGRQSLAVLVPDHEIPLTAANDEDTSHLGAELQSSNLAVEDVSIANGGSNLEEESASPAENQYPCAPLLIDDPPVGNENESLPSGSSTPRNLGIDIPENRTAEPSHSHLSHEPSESPKKPGHVDSLVTVSLNAPKDSEAQAMPTCDAANIEINYTCDEEQQNVLNHELSEQQQAPVEDGQLLFLEEQPALLEEMPPGPSAGPIEETENRINEQQQDLNQEEQRPLRCQANDDSNINEIAENNNNANIERELQDDALGAQENVNQ